MFREGYKYIQNLRCTLSDVASSNEDNNIFFSLKLNADSKIGKSVAKALCDYYRHIGVIPPRVGKTKKKDPRGRRRRRRPVIERER